MKVNVQISPFDYRRLSDEELVRRYAELREPEPLYYLFDRYGHIVYGNYLKQFKEPVTARQRTEELFTGLTKELLNNRISVFKDWLHVRVSGQPAAPATDKKRNDNNTEQTDVINFTTTYLNMPGKFEEAATTALKNLPATQRKCMELFYGNNRTYHEIAEETGIPVTEVRKSLHNGYAKLKTDIKPLLP